MIPVRFAVEGWTDVPVARRLIEVAGREPMGRYVVAHGKAPLNARIPAILRSAGSLDWLVLRDLDHDAPCASALVERFLPSRRPRRLQLRVAVRAMESWLLADHLGFAEEFVILPNYLPARPDNLDDPKQHVVDLCRRSQSKGVRAAMTPDPGSGRRTGEEYATRIGTFARQRWDPVRAAERSPSLSRTLVALKRSPEEGGWGQ